MEQKEKEYFRHLISQDQELAYGVDVLSLRSDLPIFKEHHEAPLPFLNPKWAQQVQNPLETGRSISQIFPNVQLGGGGGGSKAASAPLEEKVAEEEVVETVKTNFDVELVQIEPSNKIKVIKEVRTMCGLGLKEAKDMVEKVPSVLLKQAIREDAENMAALL